jgi:hypothetical protein
MSGRISKILLVLVAAVIVAGTVASSFVTDDVVGQEKAKYMSSQKCKSCHKDQYAAWEEMKHSHAWATLKPDQIASGKDEQGRACIQCHSTGYGQGGFTSVDATPKLVNVGCEACHGPASNHVKTMLDAMMNETEVTDKHISKSADCTHCHNPHINYKKLYGE